MAVNVLVVCNSVLMRDTLADILEMDADLVVTAALAPAEVSEELLAADRPGAAVVELDSVGQAAAMQLLAGQGIPVIAVADSHAHGRLSELLQGTKPAAWAASPAGRGRRAWREFASALRKAVAKHAVAGSA